MRMTQVMTSVAACALLGFVGCDSGHDADVQSHAQSFMSAQAFTPEHGTAQTSMPAPPTAPTPESTAPDAAPQSLAVLPEYLGLFPDEMASPAARDLQRSTERQSGPQLAVRQPALPQSCLSRASRPQPCGRTCSGAGSSCSSPGGSPRPGRTAPASAISVTIGCLNGLLFCERVASRPRRPALRARRGRRSPVRYWRAVRRRTGGPWWSGRCCARRCSSSFS